MNVKRQLAVSAMTGLIFFMACIWGERTGEAANDHLPSKLKYKTIFETKVEECDTLCVRSFDLKHKNRKNAIAVCGQKFHIFSPNGTRLLENEIPVFSKGAWQMRVAKFSKDGFRDTLVVLGHPRDTIKVFDRLGTRISTINGSNFFVKDLNGDGCDELIVNDQALSTIDGGMKWSTLWINNDVNGADDFKSWGKEGGFCFNKYLGPVFAADKNGRVLFSSKPGNNIRCLAAGDFDGSGNRDNIATPSSDGTTYILDKTGAVIRTIQMRLGSEAVNLDETMEIASGKLNKNNRTDEIVVSGRRGLVACGPDGGILWTYIHWTGENSTSTIDNLYITDLDGDGNNEVVFGKGNKIFILSSRGDLIDELTLRGDLSRWQSSHATIDVADINNDGYQEIMAVTSEGLLYVFGYEN